MIKGGPKIVTEGLVLCLDARDAKSYPGEPTKNLWYYKVPRIDSSYSRYIFSSNSTWGANHPDAIQVFNLNGSNISSFVNMGVNSGNWEVAPHAHWVYDNELRKPVVRMHPLEGYEGSWRAASGSVGYSFTSLGLAAGDSFTISWLQKTDTLNMYIYAGLYMRNSGGTNGFHAGLAQQADVGQTADEVGKWAHKSKTFTVPSGMDMSYTLGLYMYGYRSPYATIFLSDVQLETKGYSTAMLQGVSMLNSYQGERTATDGWKDRSGSDNDGTLTNMVGTGVEHFREGQVISPIANSYLDFDGTNDYIPVTATGTKTVEAWFNPDSTSGTNTIYGPVANGADNWFYWSGSVLGLRATQSADTNNFSITGGSISTGNWYHGVAVIDGTDARLYLNGVEVASVTKAFTIGSWSGSASIGRRATIDSNYANGKISVVRVYDKVLTEAEILGNYNAMKGRFN